MNSFGNQAKSNKKVLMRLQGRLGNQLFQLAYALSISQRFKGKILLDDYLPTRSGFGRCLFEELSVFNYFQYCSKLRSFSSRVQHNPTFRKIFKPSKLFVESEKIEELYYHKRELILVHPYYSFTGFFQATCFFPEKHILLKAFSLRRELICEPLLKLLHLAEKKECLAVSIRRGDFLEAAGSSMGACSNDYYLNAIALVQNKRDIDCIFVFSDDIGYCRELLASIDCQVIYVEGFTPTKSLYLMSQCKHFVVANSTFSWWGAWLSEYKNRLVIAPDPWNDNYAVSTDLFPSDWIRLAKHPTASTISINQN